MLSELKAKQLSLLVKKADGTEIFSSKQSRLNPLVECIVLHKNKIKGLVAADKVVGLAAAKLFFYAGFSKVYAVTASEPAVDYLKKKKISLVAEKIVDNICNDAGTGMCPMEKMSLEFDNEEEFFLHLRKLMKI